MECEYKTETNHRNSLYFLEYTQAKKCRLLFKTWNGKHLAKITIGLSINSSE